MIGLDLRPADEFPSDDVGYGFDNIGDVLSTPPMLVEMYLAAAEKVIDAAFRSPELRAQHHESARRFHAAGLPPIQAARAIAAGEQGASNRSGRGRSGAAAPAADLRHPPRVRRPGLPPARDARRADATARGRDLGREGRRDAPSRPSGSRSQAVLASPHFLFLGLEPAQRRRHCAGRSLPDQDFDLAARLSYFLWSSMPDDELLRLAAREHLRRPDVLESQVKRMLRDPRSRALAEQFAGQWLQTRKLDDVHARPEALPRLRRVAEAAMLEEDRALLRVDSGRGPERARISGRGLHVRERAARAGTTGLPGVEGETISARLARGHSRGGVLTMASVLAATSNPTRTSPVKRGQWILENILGAPPSPPPAGVEALKEERGASPARSTLRQQMEQHRSDPACASCHRRMDPLGFALENFDAIGAWRDQETGQSDRSDRPTAGRRAFHGPEGLRSALSCRDGMRSPAAWPRRCSRTRSAAELDRADRPVVDRSSDGSPGTNTDSPHLVLAIVESEPFSEQQRRGRGTMKRHRRISRRTVLRGLGASLALPLLEAMGDAIGRGGSDAARTAAAAHGVPVRSQRRAHAGLDAAGRGHGIRAAADPRAARRSSRTTCSSSAA